MQVSKKLSSPLSSKGLESHVAMRLKQRSSRDVAVVEDRMAAVDAEDAANKSAAQPAETKERLTLYTLLQSPEHLSPRQRLQLQLDQHSSSNNQDAEGSSAIVPNPYLQAR